MLSQKTWKVLNTDINKSLIEVVLHNRNLPDNHLDKFKLSDRLHNPFLLQDMDKTVNRILLAMKNKEKIGIFGDYDVDGIISTVLMVKLFEKLDYPVTYYIPDRENDGYGLKIPGVERVLKDKVDLLITVDNGISSNEAITFAKRQNLDVIITDHHLQEGDLPSAFAVVNPNRKDSLYPFKGLCGAGVVYKVMHALCEKKLEENDFKHFMLTNLDLVTIATIADIVPLIDENYALVKYGLKAITESMRPGLVELKRAGGVLGKKITPMVIGFYLAPRLNAAGRMKDASIAIELFLSDSQLKAKNIANELNNLNSQRQLLQQEYIQSAIEELEIMGIENEKLLIVENENWESGLIGLISGRIKEKYYRPTFAFTKDKDGNYVGSARSIDKFHITEALTEFKHLLLNYGGHQKAAGVTIDEKNFSEFKKEITAFAEQKITLGDLIQDLVIESFVDPDQLNDTLVMLLEEIGPFGEANPEPVLAIEKVKIVDIMTIGQGKHLKFYVSKGSREFECIWWQKGDNKNKIKFGMAIDIAFKPTINIWNGSKKLQLVIEDIRD